ncbi:MAG: type I methionyl aminopeptidase [bacterium]
MRSGGKILAQIMAHLAQAVKPGVCLLELNNLAERLIKEAGAEASFKGYKNFPAALCVCLNDEIVHCSPDKRKIKKSDLVKLDLGVKYKGYHTDMAITLGQDRLVRICKKALKRGLKHVKAGKTIGDIGNAIQRYVESQGYSVIKELCGHGIGQEVHMPPQILNFGKRHKGEILQEGQTICIEPMISHGMGEIIKKGIGYATKDGSLSAHFEHTVLVLKSDCQILTMV